MFKRALVSVSNKEGLVDFLRPLVKNGMEIVSTGGTSKYLKENNFSVIDVSEVTQFPEILDGRVKTLHPNIFMSLLAREDLSSHQEVLSQYKVKKIDLVVCNLYPFEASAQSGVQGMDLIEKIDVGGPSILRAAAKNFQSITVVCDPGDYKNVLNTSSNLNFRKKLAAKVFAHTSYYDSLIFQTLNSSEVSYEDEGKQVSINDLTFSMTTHLRLRYGENSQQKANWKKNNLSPVGLHFANILQGKELSYNNLLDLEASLRLVVLLKSPACVIVKHNNPCGVATGNNISEAIQRAYAADSVSAFGGIISVNSEVDADSAVAMSSFFVECILAPSFSSSARSILEKKKNLRLLELKDLNHPDKILKYYKSNLEVRSILGGYLEQEFDNLYLSNSNYNIVCGRIDEVNEADLVFAETVVSSLKSNAIVLVKEGQTIGLGMGQVNRIDAVEQAIMRWKRFHPKVINPILASDAFFPFSDSIEAIAKAGIKTIVQPGGSIKDDEVIAMAKKYELNMIITNVRHFRH